MKINWKQKLSSRKFWAAAVGFVTAVCTALGYRELTGEQTAIIITGCASLAAYVFGEGIADAGKKA